MNDEPNLRIPGPHLLLLRGTTIALMLLRWWRSWVTWATSRVALLCPWASIPRLLLRWWCPSISRLLLRWIISRWLRWVTTSSLLLPNVALLLLRSGSGRVALLLGTSWVAPLLLLLGVARVERRVVAHFRKCTKTLLPSPNSCGASLTVDDVLWSIFYFSDLCGGHLCLGSFSRLCLANCENILLIIVIIIGKVS